MEILGVALLALLGYFLLVVPSMANIRASGIELQRIGDEIRAERGEK